MRHFALAGIAGGIVGGIAFGILMHVMTAPTPDGGRMPMIQMVAMVVRSESLVVGWLYHLFNSAVIGLIFGLLAADRLRSGAQVVGAGAAYGVVWWVLGALVLMPVLLGMPVFASLRMPEMVPVAMGSLAGHLMYGVILGAVYHRWLQPAFARSIRQA
jgi:uncharacterized membrane protein YagU involved in acid resistance